MTGKRDVFTMSAWWFQPAFEPSDPLDWMVKRMVERVSHHGLAYVYAYEYIYIIYIYIYIHTHINCICII